ncbi:MAG: GyrI-like domain-containing protein [Gemmatirosa sp.]
MLDPVRYVDGPAMLLGGIRREHPYADSPRGIAAQWAELTALGALPGQVGTVTYGVICGNAPERQAFEYMSAVEVQDLAALPPALGRMRVQPQHYAVFEHHGHVSTIHETWGAIWDEWRARSGREGVHAPDFERYDARFDPRTGTGVVEIWFPIHPAPVRA